MAILIGSDDRLRLLRDPNDPGGGGIDTSNVKSFEYTSRFTRLGLRYRAVHGATSMTILPSVGADDVNARANHDDIDKGMHKTSIPLSLRTRIWPRRSWAARSRSASTAAGSATRTT